MDDCSDSCPRCGDLMNSELCNAVGCDDGWIDLYEDDPTWYYPGDVARCRECHGTGYITWCPNCGYDPAEEENDEHNTTESAVS